MKKSRTAIKWFGGKFRMVNKIVPLISHIPHNFYIEPFGGGAAILLNKTPSPAELYNDIDGGLVNFFRVMRDPSLFGEFHRLCTLTPFSREEHQHAVDTWEQEEDPVIRAHKWFIVARQSFGGHFGHSWSVSRTVNDKGHLDLVTWFNAIEGLPDVAKRLLNVQMENKDYGYIIDHYDTEGSLFYCDPPYVPSERSSTKYDNELSLEDHERLLEKLLKVKGRVVLSGYPNTLYDKILPENGWKIIDFNVKAVAFSNTSQKEKGQKMAANFNAVERIWIDPTTSSELMI